MSYYMLSCNKSRFRKRKSKGETKEKSKNVPKNGVKNEVVSGSKLIPLKIANKATKSVCKITIETNGRINHGT